MTTPTTADLLKYADLQMAAEAFLVTGVTPKTGSDLITALTDGNKHASRFTTTQAEAFTNLTEGWTVVDQRANTSTGFSGTLFRSNKTGELVMSMRSTEFLDDAARDSEATNTMEIRPYGWAFGQIDDMKKWYDELNADSTKLQGKSFAVTGYSLGGHLATAFNLLMKDAGQANRVTSTYTFNGAGVGELLNGSTLTDTITQFDNWRNNGSAGSFSTPLAQQAYASLRSKFNGQGSSAEMAAEILNLTDLKNNPIAGTQTKDCRHRHAAPKSIAASACSIRATARFNTKVQGKHTC